MAHAKIRAPDLAGVVADANAAGLLHVVIGGFAVIAHGSSLVGFKRLAGRGQDRVDLEKLERANGELPVEPIPSLDT